MIIANCTLCYISGIMLRRLPFLKSALPYALLLLLAGTLACTSGDAEPLPTPDLDAIVAGTVTTTLPTATPTPKPTPSLDRVALVALYNATDGANWYVKENWLSDAPLGEWHGVTIDDNGRVVGLDLVHNNLTGELPTELGRIGQI